MAKKLARAALDPLQIVHRRDPDTNNEDIYGIKSSPEDMDTLSLSHRRKRVSKLARHLGERIPPDLMLPKPMSVKPNRRSQRRRRFLPARTPPVPSTVPPLPAGSPTSEQETTPSLSSPSSMFDFSRPAVEETVEVFESAGYAPDAVQRPQFSQKHQRLRGTFSAPLLRERPTQPPTDGYSGGIDHSDAIFLEDNKELESGSSVVSPRRPESRLTFLHLRSSSAPPAPNVVLHRSERRQGWSGEWNVASMQDVISKLRDL